LNEGAVRNDDLYRDLCRRHVEHRHFERRRIWIGVPGPLEKPREAAQRLVPAVNDAVACDPQEIRGIAQKAAQGLEVVRVLRRNELHERRRDLLPGCGCGGTRRGQRCARGCDDQRSEPKSHGPSP
jgi:hypothetical protein